MIAGEKPIADRAERPRPARPQISLRQLLGATAFASVVLALLPTPGIVLVPWLFVWLLMLIGREKVIPALALGFFLGVPTLLAVAMLYAVAVVAPIGFVSEFVIVVFGLCTWTAGSIAAIRNGIVVEGILTLVPAVLADCLILVGPFLL